MLPRHLTQWVQSMSVLTCSHVITPGPSPNPLFPKTTLTAFGDNSKGGARLGIPQTWPGTSPGPLAQHKHPLGWRDKYTRLRLRMASRISPRNPSRAGGQGASADAVPEQRTPVQCSDKRQHLNSRNNMFNWKGIGVWSDSLMQSIPATFP